MTLATHDTQHGATVALSSDSLTLRVTSISPSKKSVGIVPTSHHGTATQASFMPGDLVDGEPITITYQNSPGIGVPTLRTTQTLTITGPTPSGGSSGEIMSITGFVTEADQSPQYDAAGAGSAALQMKTFVFKPDGTTHTRTAAA